MVFGFVVEKFSLFLKQVVLFLGKTPTTTTISKSKLFQGYSSFLGIILVSLGVLICVLAFIKYKKIEKQINQDIFEESILLDVMLTLSVLLIGIFLVIYLINSL
jgi:putative membrane protein